MNAVSMFHGGLRLTAVCVLFMVILVTEAGAQQLVKDILPGNSHAAPDVLINMNGTLYFNAMDETHGRELWKSDGTAGGTVMVKDITPGPTGSIAHGSQNIPAAMNGILYFAANDSAHGLEVWKSDGTEAGTMLVKDINPGTGGSLAFNFAAVNGTMYFTASDGNGNELWKTDGTTAGTVMVKNIAAGAANASPASLVNVNGTLFFWASDGVVGRELWKSDGTSAGTVLVKDIRSGSSNGVDGSSRMFAMNGNIYFRATNGTNGIELWKSNGTSEGTVMVKDINPGSGNSITTSTNTRYATIDSVLYFIADDGSNGSEIWRTDGTEAGTTMVKDIYSGFPGAVSFSGASMTNLNGTLYFQSTTPSAGLELWKSDGTEAGTVLVKDIYPGTNGSTPTQLTAVNGRVYFSARAGVTTNGIELWKTDGTEAGTVEMDIRPGVNESSSPGYLTDVNGILFFIADNGVSGQELWKYTGITNIEALVGMSPDRFNLLQNYPNPFNPTTSIRYQISHAGQTTLVIFDALGREVLTLVNGEMQAGEYQVSFNGDGLPSGMYLYRLQSNGRTESRKMLLMK
jgi:ELWxxDGT repeat protein